MNYMYKSEDHSNYCEWKEKALESKKSALFSWEYKIISWMSELCLSLVLGNFIIFTLDLLDFCNQLLGEEIHNVFIIILTVLV